MPAAIRREMPIIGTILLFFGSFFSIRRGMSPGLGISGRSGNSGSSGSNCGYNSSRSARPGAFGIGPLITTQFWSRSDLVRGVVSTATAPAENAASSALAFLALLTRIRPGLGVALPHLQSRNVPSKVGRLGP